MTLFALLLVVGTSLAAAIQDVIAQGPNVSLKSMLFGRADGVLPMLVVGAWLLSGSLLRWQGWSWLSMIGLILGIVVVVNLIVMVLGRLALSR